MYFFHREVRVFLQADAIKGLYSIEHIKVDYLKMLHVEAFEIIKMGLKSNFLNTE
jgi:hypothetical protein